MMEQGKGAPRRHCDGVVCRVVWLGGALGVGLSLLGACGTKGPIDMGAGDSSAGASGVGSSGGGDGSGGAAVGEGGAGGAVGTGGAGEGMGGMGGADGEDAELRAPCDPAVADCSGEEILHVSPRGFDGALGSAVDPLRTLGEALERIALVVALGESAPLVYVCATAGPYLETLELSEEHGNVGIYGGFDCELFASSAERAVFLATEPSGHRIASAGLVTLGDLRLESSDATMAGESSTAITLVNSTEVRIVRSQLVAGEGAPGQSGLGHANQAPTGGMGNPGTDACVLTEGPTPGGLPSPSACGPFLGSVGGEGGPSQEEGAEPCVNGAPGADGASGQPGLSSPQLGVLHADGYLPPVGGDGARGALGKGGLGGGGAAKPSSCATGASGGAGGGGGCPGARGSGGQGGGGSFGVVSVDTQLELVDVSVVVAAGGLGGAGGDRQLGGEPGAGAAGGTPGVASDGTAACAGGSGGRGGNGGSGGGGAGGPSIGVAYVGDAPAGLAAVVFELPLAPASGGAGGIDNAQGGGPIGLVGASFGF
jgi:hypothetical protein